MAERICGGKGSVSLNIFWWAESNLNLEIKGRLSFNDFL